MEEKERNIGCALYVPALCFVLLALFFSLSLLGRADTNEQIAAKQETLNISLGFWGLAALSCIGVSFFHVKRSASCAIGQDARPSALLNSVGLLLPLLFAVLDPFSGCLFALFGIGGAIGWILYPDTRCREKEIALSLLIGCWIVFLGQIGLWIALAKLSLH